MSTVALTVLRQFLEQEKNSGRTHVAISPRALESLRGRRQRLKNDLQQAEAHAESVLKTPLSNPAESIAQSAEELGLIQVHGANKAEKLASLRSHAETAPEARALGTLRDTMVFATGNPQASLMLIGEAPGAQEEKECQPFVGPAGEKLNQILKAMGLSREAVYISNICKFRPAIVDSEGPQGTANRKPSAVEMRSCLPYILTEIDIIRPACIIALGATAAEGLGLIGSVSKLRGQIHQVRGIPTIVTYHPSYVLREEKLGGGVTTKRQVWEDMLTAMEVLHIPISAKQRKFFQSAD